MEPAAKVADASTSQTSAEQQEQEQQREQQDQESEQPWEPSPEQQELVDSAEAIKAEGNELFGRANFQEAIAKYAQALDTAPERASQRAIYHANIAACQAKLGQQQEAIKSCTEALRLQPSYIKALVRRSAAFEASGELERALADAKRVQELEPGSMWAQQACVRLGPLVAQQQERLRDEMLGKLKDLGNGLLGKFGLSLDNFKAEKDPGTGAYSIKFGQ